jgi:hypothetical protein
MSSNQTTPPTVEALMQAMLQAFQGVSTQGSTGSPAQPVPPERGVLLSNGVGFRSSGPRDPDDIEKTKILVTRAQRKVLQAKPESLKKLRDRVCVALPTVIQEIKWGDILDSSTDSDLGSAMIGTKSMLDEVREFAVSYDLAYIFNLPLVDDLWNETELAQCSNFKDLLTNYTFFSEGYVRTYQAVINVQGFDIDTESSAWMQATLEKSIDPPLLVRIKQRLSSFQPTERGGITMFYVMANFIAKPSHEFIETGQNWIKNFKLSNFAGEHVPTANSRIKAVVEALSMSPGAVPPTSVDKYLAGMLHCSNEEFKILVQSLMGSYNNPIDRVKERFSIPETLDLFGQSLEDRFTAITTAGHWGGADKMGSIFKVSIQNATPTKKHRYPSREAWFDNQDCDKCEKKHPTWAHDDPEGYRSGRLKRPSNNSKPRTFRRRFSADTKKRIQEAVHNIIAEAQEEAEMEQYANMAGSEGGFDELGTVDEEAEDDSVDEGDGSVSALVAAALGNLLKD